MARLKPEQWAEVRTVWLSTDRTLRDIAAEFGVTEGAIRLKATHWGIRNASERKRGIVQSRLAGVESTRNEEESTQGEVAKNIADEADADVKVMRRAAQVFVRIIEKADAILDAACEGREVNAIADATRKAVDGYRRVRGLDEPIKADTAKSATEADLLERLESFTAKS